VVFRGNLTGVDRFADDRFNPPGREVANAWGRPHRAFAIDNAMEFARLWMIAGRNASLADIDFTRMQVVLILGNAENPRITQGTTSLVDYELRLPTGGEQPYTIAVFPKAAVEQLRAP
jgi:hypothetical protein